jgi:diguanylate cyclase (GGDEF)-like protein
MISVLDLENFPNSAYARELRRGVKDGPFEPELESQYRASHLARVRLRVRAWLTMTFIVAVALSVAALFHSGPTSLSQIDTVVLFPCSAALVWLAWSRHYDSLYLQIAPPLLMLRNAALGALFASALRDGNSEILAPLTLNIIAVFFFTGLLFREALLAGAMMLCTFACTAGLLDVNFLSVVRGVAISLMAGTIAAVVNLDVGRSYRARFLEHALLGELVARDPLSGLMNRRAFDEHLLRIWQHALRDQRFIALVMIDIDHFKRYNDTFGHQAGDLALRNVAQVAQGFARRPLDMAARYGGEEFVLILYDLALVHVLEIAERLRQSVENMQSSAPNGTDMAGSQLTVSLGVGLAVPTMGRTPEGLVQLADEALYDAKRAGRNRVNVKGTDAYLLLDTGAFQRKKSARQS